MLQLSETHLVFLESHSYTSIILWRLMSTTAAARENGTWRVRASFERQSHPTVVLMRNGLLMVVVVLVMVLAKMLLVIGFCLYY